VRVIATAGHVDHGKSSLVLALTGTDPDRLVEEKRRGLTIDLGFAHAVVDGEAISFVDVPGHVRFLRNMLAGVGAVDACLFVVAATEGWKPQSEEHLRILELLGVSHGVVALTKVDLLNDPELVELATVEVAERASGTFLAGAPIVPVAAPSGAGIERLAGELAELARRTPAAADRDRPRLWVDRVFAAKGSGTVVTGTLTGGSLGSDAHVVIEPRRTTARVRAIQTLGESVPRIGPGNRVALNLSGVDHHAVARGDAVVEPGRWRSTDQFDASLTVLPALTHNVSRRGAYLAYIGSGEHPVRLRVLGAESLAPGASGSVRVHLQRRTALPLLPGDRYILRESGRDETVGGGEILDVAPVLPASRARPDRRVERVVAERGWVDAEELEQLTGERQQPKVGRWVVSDDALAAASESLRRRLADAGSLGLPVGALDERERALLATFTDVVVDGGYARTLGRVDPLLDHPVVTALVAGGMAPPPPDGIDRAELRELARRGLVVERDGQWFHAGAVDAAAALAARLLADAPEGFTVSEFRDAAGVTRKHALPLVNELDARGITRRRGDRRVAGPRLAPFLQSSSGL
jgi:selenocysteine-specific elongation factor